MKIATVNIHTGEKQYMVGLDGKPFEWKDQAEAEEQIRLFKQTGGYAGSEPRNFKYVIEPSGLEELHARLQELNDLKRGIVSHVDYAYVQGLIKDVEKQIADAESKSQVAG